MIYVVAGTVYEARTYIRLTGEDPQGFRIIYAWYDLRGLAPGAKVVMVSGSSVGDPERMRRIDEAVGAVGAEVRMVELDNMTEVDWDAPVTPWLGTRQGPPDPVVHGTYVRPHP